MVQTSAATTAKRLAALLSVAVTLLVSSAVFAAEESAPAGPVTTHGLSAFGDLGYAPDFEHFSYVIPMAPKGGKLRATGIIAQSSFDSLNGYILKGDPAEGMVLNPGDGVSLVFDTLMTRAADEEDAVYGLVAKSAVLPTDRSWVTFNLRPEARFHDGSKLTSADVVKTFNLLKEQGEPVVRQQLRDVVSAVADGPHKVTYTFAKGANTRDLPLIVAELPIFSAAYYSAHKFDETTLDPPLSSGPYKVKRLEQGRYIEYQRVKDYWAKDLPVNVGRWNFDTIRFEYFRDRDIGFQAFTAHEYDLREEFTSRVWATQYNFPAVEEGKVLKRTLPDDTPSGVQGYFLNTRRPQLSDVRVRAALDLLHDFEWTNLRLFYGLYDRTTSYFEGARDLMAWGPARDEELALLEPYRAQLPPDLFARTYVPPRTGGTGEIRDNLRDAQALFTAAGWTLQNGKLKNADGEQLKLEFLTFEPSFERVIAPFIENLKLMGVDAAIRQVDSTQYQRRLEEFDFDITTSRYTQRLTPGIELRGYFGSAAADIIGSRNLSGIKDPVVDALIEKVVTAPDREQLEVACRALDRVLREGHYWVSHWAKAAHNIAHWDEFASPAVKPKYQRGILDTWWSAGATGKIPEPKRDP